MKITFVHLGREHLGIEYLSARLKNEGHQTTLAYDPGLFGPEDNVFYLPRLEKLFNQRRQVIEAVIGASPDLIAFTVYSGTYAWACAVAVELKQIMNRPVVFGGIHATLVPETVIRNHFVDFVVTGEGFEALPELAAALEAGGAVDHIANLWFRKNGEIIRNRPRPPLRDLDGLPLPDKALFEKEVNFRDDYMIITSLGCVYSCSYCCESFLNRFYDNKYFRRRSVASVMNELAAMKARYRFREVMFNDALFFTDKAWLRELLAGYRVEIGVPFRCFGKINYLDEEVCRLLKESGCYCIEFGMQTVNQDIKKRVLHRHETSRQALEAFRRCDRHGLRYDIDHMFGLPGESEQDHIDGVRFYSRLKRLNRIKCHNLIYFPGLAITNFARRENILDDRDMAAVVAGRTAGFFHRDFVKNSRRKQGNDVFVKFYKLLPILPGFFIRLLLVRRLYRLWRFVPGPLIIIGQLLAAVKGRDYRYVIYLKYYPLRIRRAVRNKWLRSKIRLRGLSLNKRTGP